MKKEIIDMVKSDIELCCSFPEAKGSEELYGCSFHPKTKNHNEGFPPMWSLRPPGSVGPKKSVVIANPLVERPFPQSDFEYSEP